MKKPTTISKESVSEYREFVQLRLRKRVLEAIEVVLEEEVDQALGCRSYERAEDRRGYRNGAETRRVTTSVGTRELRVPRARVRDEETGETTEFRSASCAKTRPFDSTAQLGALGLAERQDVLPVLCQNLIHWQRYKPAARLGAHRSPLGGSRSYPADGGCPSQLERAVGIARGTS